MAASGGWSESVESLVGLDSASTLVLVFAASDVGPEPFAELRAALPLSLITGCSTAGQIRGRQLSSDPLLVTIVRFEHSRPTLAWVELSGAADSAAAGRKLGLQLAGNGISGPRHVLLLSVGLDVNGSDLVAGLTAELPAGSWVSGGLAGDEADFDQTWVYCGDQLRERGVVAIDLGSDVDVSYGSEGGWEGFGPSRMITRSEGNVLLELDDRPALALYKEYLGMLVDDLPASALRFPLAIESPDGGTSYVRTVLAVDEDSNTMTFAGDVPVGWSARLMRTTTERLVDGAAGAAAASAQPQGSLALAISCVGRRLTLGEWTEDEIEAVADALQSTTGTIVGFYSYGEISPTDGVNGLHNQTMTVSVISEHLP
ncbi:MAG: hypothetical protein QG671_4333 [Actinomycetota bacterium]|nr:hypothetical protein [Actinomycetota bacterium]